MKENYEGNVFHTNLTIHVFHTHELILAHICPKCSVSLGGGENLLQCLVSGTQPGNSSLAWTQSATCCYNWRRFPWVLVFEEIENSWSFIFLMSFMKPHFKVFVSRLNTLSSQKLFLPPLNFFFLKCLFSPSLESFSLLWIPRNKATGVKISQMENIRDLS